jgi:hypothetical protein
MTNTLKGGSFNLLYGRPKAVVKDEVIRLLKKHDLDVLFVQEANDYVGILHNIPGYEYICKPSYFSSVEIGILVKKKFKIDRQKYLQYGDGWFRIGGKGRRGPTPGFNQVRLDQTWVLRSLHLPTPSLWKDGKIDARRVPSDRADDLIAGMKKLRIFFSIPGKSVRIACGDWNESNSTTGLYSPGWLQKVTGAKSMAPTSMEGHGHIDYPMVKGGHIVKIFKDLDIREGSDHEPVIFTIRKN